MVSKWLLYLIPLSAILAAGPALGQQHTLLSNGDLNVGNPSASNVTWAQADSLSHSSASADSTFSGLNGAWYSYPGQMPVFVPDSTLTDAMPVLIPPRVDEGMIIPTAARKDSTNALD
ncbi:MAG: hypothetical protein R6V27_13110 [Balneolaceae bacterium]